ncbi:hypothetical protein HWV62_20564 [Athelia sp. TMB]|nr:hypothetical protein HWV62_20564 [Athelia sp. TMB]
MIQFAPHSVVELGLYRQSSIPGWKKHTIAECSARGGDFLQTGGEQELVDNSGKPCLVVKIDISIQSLSEFMKSVNEDVAKLTKVKGLDAAQKATTLIPKIGAALEKIVPVIDKFAGTHPIMNAAWTVLSSAIKMAQSQKKEDDNVRDLVDSLCEMAGAAGSCPDLKKIEGTTDVAEEIGKASLEVAIVVHDYVKPSIWGQASFFARTAKHSLSDMSSRIAKSQKRCKGLTEKLDRRVAIETNATMKNVQSSDKKRDIHAWMKAPDTSPNYNAARKKHQPGTGSWFLDGSQFSKWKEHPGSVLWLYGGPGSGKTVLCSSAIHNVQAFCEMKPLARGYAYFFFDGTRAQSDTLNYDNLTRSIITQLSDRCGDAMPSALVEMYSKCDSGNRQPLEAQLENTLSRILDIFDNTYIVIDSLDECVKKADVLDWIQSITSENAGRLHIMLTSRPEPEIIRGLQSLPGIRKIAIEGQVTAGDIGAYLDARLKVREMAHWDAHDKQKIKKTVSDGSDGMFRWAELQMNDIIKCRNSTQLDRQLKALPKDLDATYAKIFKESNEPDALKTLLQAVQTLVSNGADVNKAGSESATRPLLIACWEGHLEIVNVLLEKGADVDVNGGQYGTALQAASVGGHLKIAKLLLENRADVNKVGGTYGSALQIASAGGHLEIAKLLLEKGADVKIAGGVYSSALQAASKEGHLEIAKLLLENRADVNITGGDYGSALQAASVEGHLEIVKLLLENGADVKFAGGYNGSPLQAASSFDHLEIAKLLLENGADVNIAGGKFGSALQTASLFGHLEIVKVLLENRADVNSTGGEYRTALQAASVGGNLEIAKLLLENGADVNIAGGIYGSALQAASVGGHLEIAKLLLENGADVSIAGGIYGSALQAASVFGHLEIVKVLLENRADVNSTGGEYRTALQAASVGGNLEIAKLLLENGADVNIAGGIYGSALQAASVGGHLEIAKLLLENGADVSIAGGIYGSALQAASVFGHLEIVKVLLENRADVNSTGGEYRTALQAASVGGNLEIAKLLLENGADVHIAGRYYGSALQAASGRGHLEIVKLLEEHNATIRIRDSGSDNLTSLQ